MFQGIQQKHTMDLWWFNIDDLQAEKVQDILHYLPVDLAEEINEYRLLDDKKRKLIAKFLIKGYFTKPDKGWNWDKWEKDVNGKPFIGDHSFFNISHSGKYVVVAFSDYSLGIDIEEIKSIDVEPLAKMLHTDEYQYLKNNNFNQAAFYSLWTKKEAFLKAIGIGFIDGIDRISILKDPVYFQGSNWHFHEITSWANYTGYICMNPPINEVMITRVNYEALNKFVKDTII